MSKKLDFRAEDWMVKFLDDEVKAKGCKRADVIRFAITYFMYAVKAGMFEGKDPMEIAKKMKALIDEIEAKEEQ